ncbi:MAG: tetratricopeptide repeat protein, partial [Planctomycetaceae bacterium]|nr:tetratricopeptide repeat protein [Planctomycetaceae bacterium]
MSQKPPSKSPAPVRVPDGVPWWLWLIMIAFGAAIVTSLVRKSIPEDPNVFYDQAMAALQAGDRALAEKNTQKLKDFPEFQGKQKFLEGISFLGQSKPLLAIPLLEEALKDPTLRIQALSQLGNAYLRSGQREKCIASYETALQEDENAHESRLSLANVLREILNWEDALHHLKFLKEQNFRPGVVGNMLANIYSDLGRYEDAAIEFEAAIQSDPTDAANSQKALGLVNCMIETGDFTKLEEFLPMIDAISFRESARALSLADKNEPEQALETIGRIIKENPDDPLANRVLGQIVLKMGSKEKAIETLKALRTALSYHGRNLKLFEVIAALATMAEEPELEAVLRQNVEQLREQDALLTARLAEVIRTRDDTQARFDLGDLAAGVGRLQLAQSIYHSASVIDSTLEPLVLEKTRSLYSRPLPLVAIDDAFIDFEADDAPTEPAPTEPAPTEPAPTEPAPTE